MQSERQLEYLKLLGIKAWQPKDMPVQEIEQPKPSEQLEKITEIPSEVTVGKIQEVVPETTPPPQIELTESPGDVSTLDWDYLSACVARCRNCDLHASRSQTVFGVGNQQAELMVIGEAPGEEDDKQGEPFAGRAGKLLDEMLFSIQQRREAIYIANIVKCRPPENRNPQHEEAQQCADYLQRQIELVSPKAILAVGKVAAQNLLQTDASIGKMRGSHYHYAALNIPVIVTYHPAYLLSSPKKKQKVWQDLKLLSSLLAA